MARRFHSYGPVDPAFHYAVERRELVDQCVAQLIGDSGEGGHYFTIWAPRQSGKTWLMERAVDQIRERYGDRFAVGKISVESVFVEEGEPTERMFHYMPRRFQNAFGVQFAEPATWEDFQAIFDKASGVFDRPVLLLIDEFDSLPPRVIDRLVKMFRDIYLNRKNYWLHGLALVGVRAVLGLDSPRGSPFNIQRSLHVPNLTLGEVEEMFGQYRRESGQIVEPDVPKLVFEATRGQPGLVGWFGELLTEKHNPGAGQPITAETWRRVYGRALSVEWNNTVLNLIKKARGPYLAEVISLFTDPNVPFSLRQDWCNYLYMNGIIDTVPAPEGSPITEGHVCRFSSPFVQLTLYAALTDDIFGEKGPILAIEPGDYLADVFAADALCIPPLMDRYRAYLKRLKARGIDPWKEQPRRQDLHITEAVGHFHLYAWLRDAVGRRCSISPEFPTGNGKVDLVLRTREKHTALIEVKSFIDMYELGLGQTQAAAYAKKLGLATATLAVFVPVEDEAVLAKLSGEVEIDGVKVVTAAIGWV